MKHIQDYLQTQALTLDHEAIAITRAATQAVIANGKAHIDPQLLQHPQLPTHLANQHDTLKQLFMALDAVYARQNHIQTATLYAWQPENHELIRIVHIGKPIENHINVSEDSTWHYLAARTAQSGWANIAQDVAHWLTIGELHGTHNQRANSQLSLPICGEDGIVYGILHIEASQPQPENALADWVGLALGILPTLQQLLPRETPENE